jgi:hypothetical protein
MNAPIAALQGLERKLALLSLSMDFSQPDNAPEDLLNQAIWHSVKGYSTAYPRLQNASCVPALRRPIQSGPTE